MWTCISFIHTIAIIVTSALWHTCGLHTQHLVTLKDSQEKKQQFWRIFSSSSFFFPSPSISKISDVVTSYERLPSKRQPSIALWDHTFIERKPPLSTGAKHTHKNQLCTQTHRRMRREHNSEQIKKRYSVHTLVRSMPSLSWEMRWRITLRWSSMTPKSSSSLSSVSVISSSARINSDAECWNKKKFYHLNKKNGYLPPPHPHYICLKMELSWWSWRQPLLKPRKDTKSK